MIFPLVPPIFFAILKPKVNNKCFFMLAMSFAQSSVYPVSRSVIYSHSIVCSTTGNVCPSTVSVFIYRWSGREEGKRQ